MALWLKQSTAVEVKLGPFVDQTDGFTAETALTITSAEVLLAKGPADWAAKAEATSLVHESNGWYRCLLDTADTGTLGHLMLQIAESGALPVWDKFMVVPAIIYDSLVLGTDLLDVSVTQWLGTAAATPTVAGVPEVDITHIAGAAVSTTTAQLGVNTVSLTAGAVTAAAIATDAIDDDAIATGAIASTAFAAGAINAAAIAADAITDAKVAADVTIASVTGAVGSVTGAVGSVTGAVGSVTGAVGSIATGGIATTSFAAGAINAAAIAADAITDAKVAADVTIASVTGAVGSVTGAVGSVTGAVGSVTGAVGSIGSGGIATTSFAAGAINAAAIATDAIGAAELAADAVTEIVAGVLAGTVTELTVVPAASPTVAQALAWLYMAIRNAATSTATAATVKNDAGTTIATAVLSDDGTTYTKGEFA